MQEIVNIKRIFRIVHILQGGFMKIKSREGWMLIEIIVAIALIGVLSLPLSTMALTTYRINYNAQNQMSYTHLAQKHMEISKHNTIMGNESGVFLLEENDVKILITIAPHPKIELSQELLKIDIRIIDPITEEDQVRLIGLKRINERGEG